MHYIINNNQKCSLWWTHTVYGITLLYGVMWLMDWAIHSQCNGPDKFLFALGGYVAGISLSGTPIMVAVFMNHVVQAQLRSTCLSSGLS